MHEPPPELGLRIAHARKLRGLTQAALAEAAKCSPRAVGYWETGGRTPGSDELKALSVALKISADCLLGLEAFPPAPQLTDLPAAPQPPTPSTAEVPA